jgi:hypothetical protein
MAKHILIFKVQVTYDGGSREISQEYTVECERDELPHVIARKKAEIVESAERLAIPYGPGFTPSVSLTQVISI